MLAVVSAESESQTLIDRIDQLSTQLILDGPTALHPEDLLRLSHAARAQGHDTVASAAQALAARISPSAGLEESALQQLLAEGVTLLQTLLRDTQPQTSPVPSAPAATPSNSLAGDEDLVREFITESTEHLSHIEGHTLILEQDSGQNSGQNSAAAETLNAIFRAFHTIKGLAGFLEFAEIQALAHEVETLLDLARNGQLAVTAHVIDVVLESTDIVRGELRNIEIRLNGAAPPPTRVDALLLQRVRACATHTAPTLQPSVHPSAQPSAKPSTETAPLPEPAAAPVPARPAAETPRAADNASVRIDTAKLDQLMDMVGEMVIAQTLIGHSPALAAVQDARLLRDLNQLARITTDVQRITTGMRMVPVGAQFQKLARLIRDLSRRAQKQITFETTGEDTELDKTIAEELSDPLLHMVRNSIDHGIETPAERIALGKSPTARIRIAAYHQSGQIVVEISDDGRGLNREKILAKAQKNGLIQPGAQLTENEIHLLIFEAGFSTAEKVTDISGRGVGMDVVRKHVQKLRGRIDIQSKAGEGTTFFITLPLTLAIIEGLVVVVGEHRYIVPIFSVKEMFRATPEMLSTVQGKGEVALVHGQILPILRLHTRFQIAPRSTHIHEGILVVAESHGKQFCLFVDDLAGKQEVVIKSLGQNFKHVVGVAGCAILGDGRVGLILDMDGICKGEA